MFDIRVQGREYHVCFVHSRKHRHFWGVGTTVAYASTDRRSVSTVAYCSHKDDFDDEEGEKEALKKFMALMPWSAEERGRVWQVYFRSKWEQYERMLNEADDYLAKWRERGMCEVWEV